jgi:hypothetical protein
LFDDDGGLENRDDQVDINMFGGQKELLFWYDVNAGRIWGDVSGRANWMLSSTGEGDGLRGRIWLTVQ